VTLTLFCELAGADFAALLARPGVVGELAASGVQLSVALIDLDPARADTLRHLQAHGIAWTAWLLLDHADGYWLHADNADRAAARWLHVGDWLRREDLHPEALGLDLEPPHDDAVALYAAPVRAAWSLLLRRRTLHDLDRATATYRDLVADAEARGLRTETYVVPPLLDERRAGSRLLQRALGVCDVPAGREVAMLYRSALPDPFGRQLIDAYGGECQAIAVGITGGGVRSLDKFLLHRRLNGVTAVEELRRARRFADHVYLFSLEGCVEQGILAEVCRAELTPPPGAGEVGWPVRAGRQALQWALRSEPLRHRMRATVRDLASNGRQAG
jgi:hypothetical protein